MAVKESRARTKEYMAALLKSKREDKREAREFASMQSFQQSQDRQVAMVMQAIQSIGQQRTAAQNTGPGVGMLGLLRSGN